MSRDTLREALDSAQTTVVLNVETGETIDLDDAVLIVSSLPLNLNIIRENGDDIRSFGDAFPIRLALTAEPVGLPAEPCICDPISHDVREHIASTPAPRAALEAEPVAGDGPETTCQRCERSNVWSWHAPSPLWNAVMRDPETGTDSWSIVCPPCFSELAERKNIGGPTIDGRRRLVWCFRPHDLDVADLWSDRDGRTWDDRKCLWVDARAAIEAEPVGLDVERLVGYIATSLGLEFHRPDCVLEVEPDSDDATCDCKLFADLAEIFHADKYVRAALTRTP